MSEGFSNPIIGGGGGLVYPSIHSPNFALGPPITGWSIDKNGNVFISGVLGGLSWELHPAGLFFYSGTPGTGNLVLSVASALGTDQYSNNYLAGFTSYGTLGSFAELTSAAVLLQDTSSNLWQIIPQVLAMHAMLKIASPTHSTAVFIDAIAGGVLAQHPGSFGTPESWQDLSGAMSAGWTPFAAPGNPRVKLLAESNMAYLSGSGSRGAFSAGANMINLPAAYTPVTDRSISAYDNGGLPMGCVVRSTGVVEVFPTGTTTAAVVGGMYPLD